ncbi:MAG: hypothetical protein MUC49_22385 [Raineya sp.]|jgi:hypothetical protein|nr:hypothetical protein [Raineya sp.]
MNHRHLFYILLLLVGFTSCDNRESFIKEVDGLDKLLGSLPDSIGNSSPKFTFGGDSVMKVESSNSLKLNFKLLIEKQIPTSFKESADEAFNVKIRLLSNNNGNLTQGTAGSVKYGEEYRYTPSTDFTFEPIERKAAIYELEFVVKNFRGKETRKIFKLRYVDELATLTIDRSQSVDLDSAKVGKNYEFKVKLNALTSRNIELSNPADFTYYNVVGLQANILVGRRMTLQPGETVVIRAVPQLNASYINQTVPFVHKSKFSQIQVSVLSNLDDGLETAQAFNLTLFDNLPPLPPKVRLQVVTGTIRPEIRVSIHASSIDRDAKFGGRIVKGRFVGYLNEREPNTTELVSYGISNNARMVDLNIQSSNCGVFARIVSYMKDASFNSFNIPMEVDGFKDLYAFVGPTTSTPVDEFFPYTKYLYASCSLPNGVTYDPWLSPILVAIDDDGAESQTKTIQICTNANCGLQ